MRARIVYICICVLIGVTANAQIASDSFEGSSIFTITNGSYKSGNSGASDGPASSPYATVGSQGYGCSNTTVTLISPVYDLSCYSTNSLSFRLASFSQTNATNGADAADKVQVSISTNGGGAYTQYLEVDGNSNAYWSYTGGTGSATVAYPSTATFTPAGGGNRTTDGYSTVSITSLPSVANVVIKIVMINNSTNELWTIDDFKLLGTPSCNSVTTGALSSSTFTLDCSTSQTGTVNFTSGGTFNAGNVYSVQLSNSSGSFASPTTIGTFTSTANSGSISFTIPLGTSSGTGYQVQIVSSNPAVTGSASSSFTITSTCTVSLCPLMTGAVLNSCNNPGCNEGDAEILLFNSGSYSITVSSFPAHTVNYHGNTTNYNNNTIDAYTGTVSSNTATTAGLNSTSGCSGSFIDASAAGTIPAYSTFIMVPTSFCYANYDFSNICANFSPIYVVYFATSGSGSWNTSGNLANYQAGSNPKYLVADFSWVSGCSKEYYTFDAGSEYSGGTGSGDGASVAFPQSVSTASATPTSPSVYNGAGSCALPLILPIDLLSFTVKRTYSHEAELSFTTVDEKNLRNFFISKSYDGIHYQQVSQHAAKNLLSGTNYLAYDKVEEGQQTVIYYRLEEEDMNGDKEIIGNCVLEMKPSREVVIAQSETEVFIDTPGGLSSLEVFSPTGQLMYAASGSEEVLHYTVPKGNFAHGIYLFSMIDIGGKAFIKKMVM